MYPENALKPKQHISSRLGDIEIPLLTILLYEKQIYTKLLSKKTEEKPINGHNIQAVKTILHS